MNNYTFKYVITGDNYMALPIHSERLFLDLRKYVEKEDTFRWGIFEFKNPQLWPYEDWINHMPGLL